MNTTTRSRETDKLGIPRYTVRADVILLEPVLHVYAPRLVKVHASPLHDSHNFLLASIVETLSRVAGFDIAREIEGSGRETGVDVVAEGGR